MTFAVQISAWGQSTPVSSLPTTTPWMLSSGNFQIPTGVYSIAIEALGGGGGGGNATSDGLAAGGGGGGAYAKKNNAAVIPNGDPLVVTVGGGGSGSGSGKNGEASVVSLGGTELVRAGGGSGGGVNKIDAGAGGQATVGDIRFSGGNGGIGNTGSSTGAGGGGSGAASTTNGNDGEAGRSGNNGGAGGMATDVGGAGGKGADEGSTWTSSRGEGKGGLIYGGGGGGAKRAAYAGSNANGGSGAAGFVRVYLNRPAPPVISLSTATEVCEDNPVIINATTINPVRAVDGWEWIYNDITPGIYTSMPTLDISTLAPGDYTFKVRAHYGDISWNGTLYEGVYQDSETTVSFTITPKTKTPEIRWNYEDICPIDESDGETYSAADSMNIATPWNPNGVYFANHIVWDSLVVNIGYEHLGVIPQLSQIRWYSDEACTQLVRQGGSIPIADSGVMEHFWQNRAHPREEYWATVIHPDSCESDPIHVVVHIRDGEVPIELEFDDLIGYVQTSGSPIDLSDFLDLKLDATQRLEWYSSEDDALDAIADGVPNPPTSISEPTYDPKVETDITYWVVRGDDWGCYSAPTPFRILLVPMPQIVIDTNTPLVCPGDGVTATVTINNGTTPYSFKIVNMNTGDINEQTGYTDDTYTFTATPLTKVTYRITEFSDSITPLVTYPPYGLYIPNTHYFDQVELSVIETEIMGIAPNAGPTAGGIYTSDPLSPINPIGLVTITGKGFDPYNAGNNSWVTSVTFGGIKATNIRVVDNTTITCTPPAHNAGNVTVAVTTGCTTATLTEAYCYESIHIAEITPAYAPVTGGTTIVIRGTGFFPTGDPSDVSVWLCGVEAEVVHNELNNIHLKCVTGKSDSSLHGDIVIFNGIDTRTFPLMFTYYPVKFIENGSWSEPHRWETQTDDHILPYANAVVQIEANCLQDIDVEMDSITVHPSKAYTLENGIELKANVFTLKENASFMDNNISGGKMQAVQQNVEHLLEKGRNWYVSSPVQGGVIPSISAVIGSARVEYYNETSNAWMIPSAFLTGQGYTVNSTTSDIAVKFSGTYTDGNQGPLNPTRLGTHDKAGFNLVGNPFPSYWHWTAESTQQSGLYSTIWYRTYVAGVYEFWAYNASGNVAVAPSWKDATPTGSYALGYIPPMQAFWVRVREGESGGTLTFTDAHRRHADHGSNMLKSSEVNDTESRPLLRITVDNDVNSDETVIYADPEAKKAFDTYDSDKWLVNRGVEIFTLPASSTRELVINGLPEIMHGTEIPIGFQAGESGIFRFHAKEILNLDTLDVILRDKWRKVEFDLRSGDYNFESSGISGTDRFSVLFRRLTSSGIPDINADNDKLLAYANSEGQMTVYLNIRNREGSKVYVSVFDIMGRKQAELPVIVGEQTTLNKIFHGGVYILRTDTHTTKVMVNRR
ncbi:IPT/TIG domain-containing protein [Parabacteroides sp. PF5-9]|uniref:IPT/TIG domain-containing protein n=1 Tax=Parabacteroides sp. PF5-9 TaxID=1742404 RepID=UPI002473CEDB|nr:IPT/TIG domain-containing protein [Parabacteroides sp. PF5-9]